MVHISHGNMLILIPTMGQKIGSVSLELITVRTLKLNRVAITFQDKGPK